MASNEIEVPIWEKVTLSYPEAAAFSGIGEKRLRALAERVPNLRICIDSKTRIKRVELEKYLLETNHI